MNAVNLSAGSVSSHKKVINRPPISPIRAAWDQGRGESVMESPHSKHGQNKSSKNEALNSQKHGND